MSIAEDMSRDQNETLKKHAGSKTEIIRLRLPGTGGFSKYFGRIKPFSYGDGVKYSASVMTGDPTNRSTWNASDFRTRYFKTKAGARRAILVFLQWGLRHES